MDHALPLVLTMEHLSLGVCIAWLALLSAGYLVARYSDQWSRNLLRMWMHPQFRSERLLCKVMLGAEIIAGATLYSLGSDTLAASIFSTRILMILVGLPRVLAAANLARRMRYGTPDKSDPTMRWYLRTWFVDLFK